MADTPTSRSLREARKRGWQICVVEKWIAQTRQRKDAFGFGDLLAVNPDGNGAVLIQATSNSGSHMSSRINKIKTDCAEAARAWLAAGNRILVWGWAKRGKKGKRKTWQLREVELFEI